MIFSAIAEPRAKCFVHFRRAEQLKGHLLAAGAIDVEERRAGKSRVVLKQAQRLAILPEGRAKARVLFPGELDHAQLRDHDRPAEDRDDAKKRENDLAGDRRVFEREEKTAGRENLRK